MTLDNPVSQSPNFLSLPGRFIKKEILPILTNFNLAIIQLLVIAVFSASGTVIEQGQSIEFYQSNYPEHPALFGFLTWKVIIIIGLDHVYRTWWFLSLLVLLGASLIACTFTTQFPILKHARRWKYYEKPRPFQRLALSAEFDVETDNFSNLENLKQLLEKRRYQVFKENDHNLYARKGLTGKIGPIIVHIGIVTILLGGIWGAMTGFMAQEMITSGNTFQVKNIIDAGPLAAAQIPKNWSVKVNRFWIDYTPSGGIDQFYSDMSVLDNKGIEVDRKTIFVNQPLRHNGVTFYQTDWGIAAVRVRLGKSPIFQLPMAQLDTQGKGRLWGTWIPTKPDLSEGVSLLAKDLQGTVLIYSSEGKLIDTVRSGMSTEVNGVTLKILEVLGSTGLQIKADPGIPLVYSGFAFLMAGVVMSYISHSQIWALQKDGRLYVGGKTNRAQVAFEREFIDALDNLTPQKNAETKVLSI